MEFATAILHKENQLTPLLPDEDLYYQINLASKEQEIEKKQAAIASKGGSLDDLEEKSISFYATELMNQMVKDPKKAAKLLTEDGVKEVLTSMQINASDPELVLQSLQILEKASDSNPKLCKIIEQNNGLNAVYTVMNQHPTDDLIVELGGEILNNLGGDQILPDVRGQVPKLTNNIKPNNDESISELTKADVLLANLLAMPPPEKEDDVIADNQAIIKAIETQLPIALENPELLAANLLLVSRMAKQGELTKEAIRQSAIPKILLKDVVPNQDIMKPENGKISELALGCLESMIGGDEEYITMLDAVKGKPVEVLTSEEKKKNLGNVICETLKANDNDLLEEILNIAELKGQNSDKPHSMKTIEKATGLMAKLCENDSSLAAAMMNKGGVSKLKNLFEDLAKKQQASNGVRESPIKQVGKLMGALSKTPAGFQSLVKETDLVQKIVDDINAVKINEDLEKDQESLQTLNEGLKALKEILNNDYDKSDIIEYKVPECVANIVRRFNNLPVAFLKESPALLQSQQLALKTLEKLAKDPALARVLAKSEGPAILAKSLQNSAVLSQDDLGLRDPGNKPDNTTEIIGSGEPIDRIIENTLSAFAELTTNPKNAEKMELLNSKNNSLTADLKEILANKAKNPVIVASGMKILENCLKASSKQELQQLQANEIKEMEGLLQQLVQQYPKLPLISSIAKNVCQILKNKDPESLVLEEKALQKQELNKVTEGIMQEAKKQAEDQAKLEAFALEVKALESKAVEELKPLEDLTASLPIERKVITVSNNSELMTKLDLVSDSLEEFLKKSGPQVSKAEEEDIGKLVVAIGNFAGGGKVAQLHNMGVTDGLLNLVSGSEVKDDLKAEGVKTLAKLTKDQKLVEKMAENEKLASTIAKGLFENSKKKLNALQKGMVKDQLELAGNLAGNEDSLKQFCEEGGIKAIIEMMKNNKETPEILVKCADSLTRLAVNEEVINEIISLDGVELISELYDKYPDLLEILRAFAGLVAKLATNDVAKNKLGEGLVISIIVDGVKIFNDDLILGVNSCLALGNLAYNHQKNAENIIKTEFIAYTHNYIKKMMKEAELISNVCSFFNSLGFKNSPNKKEMGKRGVMDDLQKIFEAYTSGRDLKLDTLKNCFK